jgi:xanthine dehydrogenase small subunit
MLRFAMNQQMFAVPDGSPELDFSLLQYLRQEGLTGCKQVCGEGGCGACTAVLSRWEPSTGAATHQSVATCLVPLPSIHQMQVTTIEGLSKLSGGRMHPLSEAFYELGASQCGFCTPGFIMSFAARLAEKVTPRKVELEHVFDGNLCRCTGYRPIMDAAAVFCADPLQATGHMDRANRWRERLSECASLNDVFPEAFRVQPGPMRFNGPDSSWLQPVDLDRTLDVLAGAATTRIMAGNTDLGYAGRYRPREACSTILLHRVEDMRTIEWSDEGIQIGAAVTIEQLSRDLTTRIPEVDPRRVSGLTALLSQCRFLGNHQIRSVATVGGGIVNFNHYSDLVPIWVACDAELLFRSPDGETRKKLLECYRADGTIDLDPKAHGVLVSIRVPITQPNERVINFKYARRRLDSITFMSAGIRYAVDESDQRLQDVVLCFDGLGSPGLRAVHTERTLSNGVWDSGRLREALQMLKKELRSVIRSALPRRLQDYQIRLAQGALLRAYQQHRIDCFGESPGRDETLTLRYPEIAHRSQTVFVESADGVLGRAIPHRNARNQTTGEALYSNDHSEAHCLYASMVTSPVARGTIESIDVAAALGHPEVVGFVSAQDIPGKNLFGLRVEDEEVLASERVHFVGQPVGAIVARSAHVAREQAWAVEVHVKEEQPILSIDRAIEEKSTHGRADGYLLTQGNVESAFLASEAIVEGVVELPGQNHFYLEAQNALVIPREEGFRVYASTQSPSDVVDHVARLMNVPKNKVEVEVGRLGGGFGGKQLRSGPIAAICALAAKSVGRPVKLTLDRAQDMAYCPGREPAKARYRAGFDRTGRIRALDIDFYLSGGFSTDYSADVTETATLLMDSAYKIENIRVNGVCVKTNIGSCTATRGFGKPQSSAIIETVMDHGARALALDPTEVRGLNLYQRGDRTITKTEIKDDVISRCWNRALEKADYGKRRTSIDEFNRNNKWIKRGVAATVSKGNMGFIESDDINRGLALIHVLRDGTVSVNHSGVEMGQGINTRMAQVAAAGLRVPLDDVVVTDTQSALIPNTPPTTMVATDLIGEAIVKACDTLNKTLDEFSGTFRERVEAAYVTGMTLSSTGIHTMPRLSYDYERQQGDISYLFVWGAAVSVVEVDVLSGGFRILENTIVQDCGKSLNPHLDIGQAEGGFMFGVGYYLMEEMIYSDAGRLISDNVSAYKIPSCGDVPLDWDIELLNYQPTLSGIHSSKGIGESNVQLGLSAYFAVKDAVAAARSEAGMEPVFDLGFPASVDRVCECLPGIDSYARRWCMSAPIPRTDTDGVG